MATPVVPSPFLWGPVQSGDAAGAFAAFPVGAARANGRGTPSDDPFVSQIPLAVMAAFEEPAPSPDRSRHKFAAASLGAVGRSGTPELPTLLSALSVDSAASGQGSNFSPAPAVAAPSFSPWAPAPATTSPFNPASQEFVPSGAVLFGPPAAHAGVRRRPGAHMPAPYPADGSISSMSRRNGPWNTMTVDTSSMASAIDISINGNRNGADGVLLSPPLDPKKKREHVSAPNSPLSPPLADPQRSLPARGYAARNDPNSAMKRRKLDFPEEPVSPGAWRQAAGATGFPQQASPPKMPSRLEAAPYSDDRMDYVNSELVDLSEVVVPVGSPGGSALDSSTSSGHSSIHDGDQSRQSTKTAQRLKHPIRNFMREFGARSKSGYHAAKNFAFNATGSPERRSQPPSPTSHAQFALRDMPQPMRSQICLELADLAKRESEFTQARMFFRASTQLDPLNAKAWLEYAKCEEENGHLSRAQRILSEGFKQCCIGPESAAVDRVSRESIILRMLRLYSRTGEIQGVRQLIGTVLNQYVQTEGEKTGLGAGRTMPPGWPDELNEYTSSTTPPSPTRPTPPSNSPTKPGFLSAFTGQAQGQPTVSTNPTAAAGSVHTDDESSSGSFPWRVIMEGANVRARFCSYHAVCLRSFCIVGVEIRKEKACSCCHGVPAPRDSNPSTTIRSCCFPVAAFTYFASS